MRHRRRNVMHVALVAGVLLLALAVRLLYLHDSSDALTYDAPIIDSLTYHEAAGALLRGDGLTAKLFWQPVFYPAFLASAYAVGGSSIPFARLLQLLIGVATCALTYRLGATVFGNRAGLLAAGIVAVYGPLLFFEGELLATGWACLWSVLLVSLLEECGRRARPLLGLVTGLCGALAMLTRPTFAPFLAAAGIWLLLAWRREGPDRSKVATCTALLLTGFLAASLPVAWQSSIHSGRFSILPASSGINLYIGNNPDSASTVAIRPGADWENLTRSPGEDGVTHRSETSEYFRGKVVEYARSDPLGFAGGLVAKAVRFVSSREIPRNVDVYVARSWSPTLSALVWKIGAFGFPFGVLLPLTLLGLIVVWQRVPVPVRLFLLLYPSAIVLVFVSARYRAPVVPVMAVVAAGGLIELKGWLRRGSRSRLLATAAGIVAVVILSVLPGPFPQEQTDHEAELLYLVGRRVMERGDLDRAVELLSRAVARDPDHSDAHNSLGVAHVRRGDLALAVRHYDLAVRSNPQSVTARVNLGRVLTARRDFDGAIRQFRLALEQRPADAEAHHHLGVLLSRQGMYEESLDHFSRSLASRPNNADTLSETGRALLGAGRTEEAVSRYRQALETARRTGDRELAAEIERRLAELTK